MTFSIELIPNNLKEFIFLSEQKKSVNFKLHFDSCLKNIPDTNNTTFQYALTIENLDLNVSVSIDLINDFNQLYDGEQSLRETLTFDKGIVEKQNPKLIDYLLEESNDCLLEISKIESVIKQYVEFICQLLDIEIDSFFSKLKLYN